LFRYFVRAATEFPRDGRPEKLLWPQIRKRINEPCVIERILARAIQILAFLVRRDEPSHVRVIPASMRVIHAQPAEILITPAAIPLIRAGNARAAQTAACAVAPDTRSRTMPLDSRYA